MPAPFHTPQHTPAQNTAQNTPQHTQAQTRPVMTPSLFPRPRGRSLPAPPPRNRSLPATPTRIPKCAFLTPHQVFRAYKQHLLLFVDPTASYMDELSVAAHAVAMANQGVVSTVYVPSETQEGPWFL